jgi:hypothetical protein
MQGRAHAFEENVMPPIPAYVGIDVAKVQLDIAVRPRVVKKLPCLAATAFGDEHAELRGAET